MASIVSNNDPGDEQSFQRRCQVSCQTPIRTARWRAEAGSRLYWRTSLRHRCGRAIEFPAAQYNMSASRRYLVLKDMPCRKRLPSRMARAPDSERTR